MSTSLNWRCQTTGLPSIKGFWGKLWLVWHRRELFSHVLIGVGEGRGKCYVAGEAEGCETGIVGQLIPLHSVGRWSSVAGDLPNWCRVISWKPVGSFERVFWKVPRGYSEVFFYRGLFLLCVWDHCHVGQWSCCHTVDQIRINYSIKQNIHLQEWKCILKAANVQTILKYLHKAWRVLKNYSR